MRYKKATLSSPVEKNDTETVTYDVHPKTGAIITANKIKNKYKKTRAKNKCLPVDLDEIEEAETVNYADDTNIPDVNLNRNATIAARK